MAAGDITDAGPYSLPLSSAAKTAIKALRNSANDNWMAVVVGDGANAQVFIINEEEA